MDATLSELMRVFRELPPDTQVKLERWQDGNGWTCTLEKSYYSAIGEHEKLEGAVTYALIEFYDMHKVAGQGATI